MKRIILFTLVLAMLIIFAGCLGLGRGKRSDAVETSTSQTGKTESGQDTPAKTETSGPVVSDKQTESTPTPADSVAGTDTVVTPVTTAAGTETTNIGNDHSGVAEPPIDYFETSIPLPETTGGKSENPGVTEPSIDYPVTNPPEPETTVGSPETTGVTEPSVEYPVIDPCAIPFYPTHFCRI